jgi:nitric-oxide synthase
MWLFFGCRQHCLDLYREEKAAMLQEGVLDKVYLALSRELTIPKVKEVANNRVQFSMGC